MNPLETEGAEIPDDRRRWLDNVVEKYQQGLLAYAVRMLHGDFNRAQDAVQETFLKLVQQPTTNWDQRLAPWLFAVCRSKVIDMQRAQNRQTSTTTEILSDTPDALTPNPSQVIEQRETDSLISTRIEALPMRQQELLRLKIQAGLSYREIAEVTGLTVTNVGYLLHQSLRSLRESLIGQER